MPLKEDEKRSGKLDLRNMQSIIRDQGIRPTCLACAVTSGHEYIRSDDKLLSVEYLHWLSVKRDGASKRGVSLKTTLNVLADTGQPYEEVWPYSIDIDDTSMDYIPPNPISPDECFKITWGRELRLSIEDLKLQISMGRAVVLGVRLFYSFHYANDGRIQLPESGDSPCGSHAVLLVGYDDNEPGFIFKNSWGNEWGDKGYGFIPYSYLLNHGLATYVFSNKDLRENGWAS